MIKTDKIFKLHPLQDQEWPIVNAHDQFPDKYWLFLRVSSEDQDEFLTDLLRRNKDKYLSFVHNFLGIVYAYCFGYKDSPLYLSHNKKLEQHLLRSKLIVEDNILLNELAEQKIPALNDNQHGFSYLRHLATNNPGVDHVFFNFIEKAITPENFVEFLRLEVIRNEVVDDEVALAVAGLQGQMKQVLASNLWDECGNGELKNFHTYWLRRLLTGLDDWQEILVYRKNHLPWFSKITSNIFDILLTRPGFKYRAYGFFLITESWVKAHFEKILHAMQRLGMCKEDITIYFTRHVYIDPHHSEHLLLALEQQTPSLTSQELREVILGAHIAISAGISMYDQLLNYFLQKNATLALSMTGT